MTILNFFRQAKYIKKLEETIKTHEGKAESLENWIAAQRQQIATAEAEILKLKSELSELKSDPPVPKLASNIDMSDPIFHNMIKAGRNVLVKKAHPDHGGSREEFEKVEKAFEILKGLKIQPQEKPFNYGLYGCSDEALMQREALYRAAQKASTGRYGAARSWPYIF